MFDQQKKGHGFKKKSECCKTLTDCHIFDVGKNILKKTLDLLIENLCIRMMDITQLIIHKS